jgi:DNA-binding LacI/PurR family transcriptional regulator
MPRPDARRVTLREVAAELGVSAKTVSNAFGRPDQLSVRLREQILTTAARLGYPGPDPLAAGLRTGRVGAVGVAYSNRLSYAFEDPVSVELFAGITSAAERAGAGLLLLPASTTAEGRAAALSGAVVDGLIVNSLADDDPLLPVAITRRLPLAIIDQPDPTSLAELGAPPSPWIGIDDHTAAAALAEHLLALGHRRFGVVCFGLHRPPTRGLVDERAQATASFAVSRHRLAGFRGAALRAGLDWARVPVAQGTDSTIAEGHAGAATVLATTPRPTALLCLSDRLAQGALRAAAELGLRVPDDLSIAGFDDAPPASDLGLTTIRQPNRRKGELAIEALLRRLDEDHPEPARMLCTELVIRTSTGPPPPATIEREPR